MFTSLSSPFGLLLFNAPMVKPLVKPPWQSPNGFKDPYLFVVLVLGIISSQTLLPAAVSLWVCAFNHTPQRLKCTPTPYSTPWPSLKNKIPLSGVVTVFIIVYLFIALCFHSLPRWYHQLPSLQIHELSFPLFSAPTGPGSCGCHKGLQMSLTCPVSSASPLPGVTLVLYQQFLLPLISSFTLTSTLQPQWLLLLVNFFVCSRLTPDTIRRVDCG